VITNEFINRSPKQEDEPMKPLDEFLEHRLLDRFHYDDRQDDGYGPDSPRVGDKGWITWEYPTGDEGVSRPFEIVRDDEHVRSEGTDCPCSWSA